MPSKATTVRGYLSQLPPERRKALNAVRKVIKENLPDGYKEVMQYGVIGYVVPLKLYPQGYLKDETVPLPFAGLAAPKNYMSIHLFCIYTDKKIYEWFIREYKKSGKRMDMGKSCVRFRTLDDLPLELIGKLVSKIPVKKFISAYEKSRP